MKNALISDSIKPLFDDYKGKILAADFSPVIAVDALLARYTAVWLLESDDLNVVEMAEQFITKTSSSHEALLYLKEFVLPIKSWDKLQICSVYNSEVSTFVEYQLTITSVDNIQETLHYHAQFQRIEDHYYFINQSSPQIRIIGDPILHQPGIEFPTHPSLEQLNELTQQIYHAKSVLIQTGGAGIAANQCAGIEKPYQFAIVGVFYEESTHVAGVTRRYPTANFPKAQIMVNPKVITTSPINQHFNHACLSVPSPNRCSVASPKELTVTYLDPTQDLKTVQSTFSGVDAVVLWHELTHILEGKTYIDVVFENLTSNDLDKFAAMIKIEQLRREENHSIIPELTVPPFHFTVTSSEEGGAKLEEAALQDALGKMTNETLTGLLIRCQCIKISQKKKHCE